MVSVAGGAAEQSEEPGANDPPGSSERPGLEGRATHAHLTGRQVPRLGSEVVHTRVVALDDPDLERAARPPRDAGASEHEVAVVTDPNPPPIAGDVLVDLELHLEPSVLRRDLQLPVAGVAARPPRITSF